MKRSVIAVFLLSMIAGGHEMQGSPEIDSAVDRGFVPNQLTVERLRSLPNLHLSSPSEVESAVKRVSIAYEARRALARKEHPELDWSKFDRDRERRRPFEDAEIRVFLSYFRNPSYKVFRFFDKEVQITGWVVFSDKTPVRVWNFKSEDLQFLDEPPNQQSPLPTPASGTPVAGTPVAPAPSAADR
jgi:hypothetical protein